jgi:D-alanyl-D-alanine dipeptidase
MTAFGAAFPLRVDLVYADGGHPENIFKTALYRPGARLWLHAEFAAVVLTASRLMAERHGGVFILKDGLRTVEAQAAMQRTAIVRANPHWSHGPERLLSLPGQGGHPRGMAVDVVVADAATGALWDMGTSFDHLSTDPQTNPARRGYQGFAQNILDNRQRLEACFNDAARLLNVPLLPLPSEWWDFRFPASHSERYVAVSDADLPASMQMTRADGAAAEDPALRAKTMAAVLERTEQALKSSRRADWPGGGNPSL